MIIEFELDGSKCLHKGIFDTTGFWVRYEREGESILNRPLEENADPIFIPSGYKLVSHFSFAYYHEKKEIVDLVYSKLLSVLRGANNVEVEGVGYLRKLNK